MSVTAEQSNILQVSFKSNVLYIMNYLFELVRESEDTNNRSMNILPFSKAIISLTICKKLERGWLIFALNSTWNKPQSVIETLSQNTENFGGAIIYSQPERNAKGASSGKRPSAMSRNGWRNCNLNSRNQETGQPPLEAGSRKWEEV